MNDSGAAVPGPAEGVVRPSDSVEMNRVEAGTGTEMQVLLGPSEGASNFVMRRFVMESGGGMPLHTNVVEHEQYVLRGAATVVIGDRAFEVTAGDAVFISAGVPHSYSVTDGPFEFLCIVPNDPDQIRILQDEC